MSEERDATIVQIKEPKSSPDANTQVEPVVKVRGLHFGYAVGPVVLHGVDLDIGEGEVMCLLGLNGCGK